jgi:hypothetical protein
MYKAMDNNRSALISPLFKHNSMIYSSLKYSQNELSFPTSELSLSIVFYPNK